MLKTSTSDCRSALAAAPLRAALLIAGVLACPPGNTQTSQVITFKDAVEIALKRNVDLQNAQVDAALGDVAVSEARLRFLPDLYLDANGTRNFGRSFNQTEGRVLDQTIESATVDASSGLSLFNGFRDVAGLRQSLFSRAAGHKDLARATETAIFTVASDFLSLTQRQEQLDVLRDYLAGEVRLREQIQQYVEAGARAASDLHQQEAIVESTRLMVIQAQNLVEAAQIDLMNTLQLDPAGAYDFQPPAMTERNAADLPKLDNLLQQALAQRSDLDAEEARLRAAEQAVWVARSGYWPSLTLGAGYGSAYSSATETSFNDQLDLQRGGSVGLTLSIPVFERGATRSASRRAQLELRRERIALDNVRETVGLQVRRAHLNFLSALEQFEAAQTQQRAAERGVQSSEERFKSGAAPLIELTPARTRYVVAASALVDARNAVRLQRVLLDYYLGSFDHENFAAQANTAP